MEDASNFYLRYHPVLFLQEILDHLQPVHLEMLMFYEFVQSFQIYYRPVGSIFLWDHEDLSHKLL